MNLWQGYNLLFEGKWQTGGFWLYSVRLWSRVKIRTLFGFASRLNSEKVTTYMETWLHNACRVLPVRGSARGVPAGVARVRVHRCHCVCAVWVCVCLSVCLLDARGPASFTALTRSFIALAEIAEVYLCLPPPDGNVPLLQLEQQLI